MFEIMALLTLIVGAVFVVAVVAVLGLFFKLLFKVVLLPFWLLGLLFKGVFAVAGLILAIVLAPIAIVLLLLVLPFLAVAGIFGLGVWVIA
jgi:hypothetical protein